MVSNELWYAQKGRCYSKDSSSDNGHLPVQHRQAQQSGAWVLFSFSWFIARLWDTTQAILKGKFIMWVFTFWNQRYQIINDIHRHLKKDKNKLHLKAGAGKKWWRSEQKLKKQKLKEQSKNEWQRGECFGGGGCLEMIPTGKDIITLSLFPQDRILSLETFSDYTSKHTDLILRENF